MTSGFSIDFSMVRSPNRVLSPLKVIRKSGCHLLFRLQKSSFGRGKLFPVEMYAPPKEDVGMAENISECALEALFKGVSTRFGLHSVKGVSCPTTVLYARVLGIVANTKQKSHFQPSVESGISNVEKNNRY